MTGDPAPGDHVPGDRAVGGRGGVGESGAHLVLVGLPGVGKSSVGAGLARRLGVEFMDLDVEIERRSGRTVAELFREEGEAAFRRLERSLTEELRSAPAMVIAPGGGWMSQPGLPALLRPPARIIYLRASPEVVARRMGAERSLRPLLAGGEVVPRLAALLADREADYRAADLVVDTELIDVQQVIDAISELARLPGGG